MKTITIPTLVPILILLLTLGCGPAEPPAQPQETTLSQQQAVNTTAFPTSIPIQQPAPPSHHSEINTATPASAGQQSDTFQSPGPTLQRDTAQPTKTAQVETKESAPQQEPLEEPTSAPPAFTPTPTPFYPSAESDRLILEELYHSTNGDSWTNNENWLTDQPLQEWYGVETDHERLVELDLASNGLSGTLPARLWLLDSLETLYLEDNGITGELPPLQGDDTSPHQVYFRITTIDISNNQLSGCVPVSLTEAMGTNYMEYSPLEQCPHPDREALETFYNDTGGPEWTNQDNWMTDAPLSEWHGVTATRDGKVTSLNLAHNNLDGPITAITRMQNLQGLSLGNNLWSDVAKARHDGKDTLSLITERKGNLISLPLPDELFAMSSLEAVHLQAIGLTGQLPTGFANMDSLTSLGLSYNDLESPMPPEVQNFRALTWLDLRGNLFTGQIPVELTQIKTLEYLLLSRNQFEGEIPAELRNMTELVTLDLSRNLLEGKIPPELGELPQLLYLELERNQLSGPIPEELGHLPALTHQGNEEPEYSAINLQYNQLTGEIPPSLGNLIQLQVLALDNNQLSGKIPQELANLDNLISLGLGHNLLTGRLPRQLAEMKSLQGLSVRDNQLTGKIPKEFDEREDLTLFSENNNFAN